MSDPAVATPSAPRKAKPRITHNTRAAIAAASALGLTQPQIAQQVGVHRNTVQRIQNQVRDGITSGAELATDWRRKLSDTLPSKAVDALEASIEDRVNVHAAAGTGAKLLQGLGILGGETSSQTINVFVANQASLPDDIRALLCGTSDVIDVTPTVMDSVTPALLDVTDDRDHNL